MNLLTIKIKAVLAILGLFVAFNTHAQSFNGLYSIGKTTFRVKALSNKDREAGLFNIVYTKGNKNGTMASMTEDPKFEFVFDEHEGDIYLGTFYFTKAWKGKPLSGYYLRAKDKRKLPVKFLRE